MPHQFNIGDRVRCIRNHQWGREGQLGTITRGGDQISSPCVKWDEQRFDLWIEVQYLELIENQEPIPTPPTTFYTLVYKTRNRTRKQIMGFEREEDFNQKKTDIIQSGGTVFASKKLKLSNIGA